jgi:transcriptional regulator with XRE-family HTH domain
LPEAIDVKRLGEQLRRVRLRRGYTLKRVSKATKISVATVSRIERGGSDEIGSATLVALAGWMGKPVERFKENQQAHVPNVKTRDDTPEVVELYLRADKKLDKRKAIALSRIFRTAYEELSKSKT